MLHNLIIKPEELDTDIRQYFRHTLPSLQEFYSQYAAQWEYFHETDEASDAKFLHFLKNSAYPFSMRYNMVDLNVKYYLERFQALRPRSKELIKILGKQHQGIQKRFKMTAGIRREEIVTHSTRSDITDICEGNDLNSLLPIEYCYLAEKSLQPIFFERYTEKKLRIYL